ncbi:DUF3376 domain-containing protein [Streptomyces agglomeratus]|uniref:DUF3376 domain-containing protein n=1 Tax=Streptomyces agglomeratus TaxID=285458 RepID=UPI0009A06DC2
MALDGLRGVRPHAMVARMDASRDEEIRLALVMNGGVSLAVWMGGVTHEIDLLRRATDPAVAPGAVPKSDQPMFERWRAACSGSSGRPRRRVIVDVVAGTSAGGLNGTLLATAIARGTALDPAPEVDASDAPAAWSKLRRVWREDAALQFDKLLPRPGRRPRPSVLDGAFFARAVDKVLREIKSPVETTGNKPAQAQSPPVTLFVTATSTGPDARLYQDAFGNPLTCPDHRRVFRFEKPARQYTYRANLWGESPAQAFPADVPRNDFDEHTGLPNVLASVARASASYPLAFAPVAEPELSDTVRVQGVGDASWLMDGGVLDNAPFGPVLEAIASRELSGPVERLLIYVVPSAGAHASAEGAEPEPRWTRVLSGAIQHPREADLRADVQDIQALLEQADGLHAESRDFFAALLTKPDQREQAAATARLMLNTYRQGRTVGGIFEARRLVATTSLAATQTAADLGGTVPLWVPERPEPDTAALTVAPWRWGITAAERTVRLFLRDLRRRLGEAPGNVNVSKGLTKLSTESLPRIDAVKQAFTDRLRLGLEGAGDAPAQTVGGIINQAIEDLRLTEALAWLVSEATASYCRAAEPGLGPDEVLQTALHVEVISRAFHVRSPSRPAAPFKFLRLGPDVATPVLGTALSDQVMANAQSKLYGTQLAHFGAFGDADWRDWDWLLGRLDAVAHLSRALGLDEDWVLKSQLAVLQSENVSRHELSARMQSMLGLTLSGLLDDLKDRPDHRGRDLVRNLVDSAADGLAHLEHPAALRWPARILARAIRRPLRLWLRTKGF